MDASGVVPSAGGTRRRHRVVLGCDAAFPSVVALLIGGVVSNDDGVGVPFLAPEAGSSSDEELVGRIVEMGRLLGSLHHQLVHAVAEYDRRALWRESGHSTCAAWIADTLGVALGTARQWLRVGHALAKLPSVDGAFAAGELSYRQVRTLVRIAVDHPDREAELLDLAKGTAPRDLAVSLAAWVEANEEPEDTERRHRSETGLSARTEPDGMGVITLRLPPAQYGAVMAAVDGEMMSGKAAGVASMDAFGHEPFPAGTRPSLGYQRAAAFMRLFADGGAKVRHEVIVHVRGDGNRLDDGTPINDNAVARLLPGSMVRAMIHDAEANPIDVSGRHRFPTERQRLVLKEREQRCECGASMFLEADHDPPFEESRRTVLRELKHRCSNCHRERHRDDRTP